MSKTEAQINDMQRERIQNQSRIPWIAAARFNKETASNGGKVVTRRKVKRTRPFLV